MARVVAVADGVGLAQDYRVSGTIYQNVGPGGGKQELCIYILVYIYETVIFLEARLTTVEEEAAAIGMRCWYAATSRPRRSRRLSRETFFCCTS